MKFACTVNHVVREVCKTLLVRNLGDNWCKSAKLSLLLNEECCTSNLCCCAGCLKTGSTTTDYNHVARLVYLCLHVILTTVYGRVYCTADWLVETDSVSGASDVTWDTFSDIAHISELYLIHPLRVSDKSTAHTDEISIASCKNILGYLWVTDISYCDTWLVVFLFYSLCHEWAPSVR